MVVSRDEKNAKRWHISLPLMFGVVALVAFEIWLFQRGLIVSFFAPLVVAVSLEVAGYPKTARFVGLFTILWWFLSPIVYSIVH